MTDAYQKLKGGFTLLRYRKRFFVDKKIIQNIIVIELLFIYLQQIKPTTFKKRANSLTFKFRNTLYKKQSRI